MISFAVVGSGWRSLFYVRIAMAFPEKFNLCALLCRTEEKAQAISKEYSVRTTLSEEEVVKMNPDFVVIAVTKADVPKVAMHWMDMGFCVLSETPAGQDVQTLERLWEYRRKGGKIVVAEQYFLYPEYRKLIEIANSGIIGRTDCLNISLAHGYHGISLMRAILGLDAHEQFTVSAKAFSFTSVQTAARGVVYTDGRKAVRTRTVAVFEFENGKTALFDFDPDQYRSSIRKNTLKLQGERGEIVDDTVYYLDENNLPKELTVKAEEHVLDSDHTAVAELMERTALYAKNLAPEPYPLCAALQDSYTDILMSRAIRTGSPVRSEKQIWN